MPLVKRLLAIRTYVRLRKGSARIDLPSESVTIAARLGPTATLRIYGKLFAFCDLHVMCKL